MVPHSHLHFMQLGWRLVYRLCAPGLLQRQQDIGAPCEYKQETLAPKKTSQTFVLLRLCFPAHAVYKHMRV